MSNFDKDDYQIYDYDRYFPLPVRVVVKSRTAIAELAKKLFPGKDVMLELWLLPEEGEAFTDDFLKRMSCESVQYLANLFDCNNPAGACYTHGLLSSLLEMLKLRRSSDEMAMNVSVISTPYGPVISYVLGTKEAMNVIYEKDLREMPEIQRPLYYRSLAY